MLDVRFDTVPVDVATKALHCGRVLLGGIGVLAYRRRCPELHKSGVVLLLKPHKTYNFKSNASSRTSSHGTNFQRSALAAFAMHRFAPRFAELTPVLKRRMP